MDFDDNDDDDGDGDDDNDNDVMTMIIWECVCPMVFSDELPKNTFIKY